MHASLAAARDDVTAPLIAASCSASTANPAPLIWGDSELAEMDDNDAFTVVRTKKRRRDSPVLPAMAAQSNSAGASRRQRSSTGWIPPVQEIRTTTAHVMEARARQASCTEEQCLYLEYCPDYQSYQYLRAIERVVGGPKNIFQFSKINGHYLLGLASKSLAEHLVREGLEIERTLIRTFPFRKSSTRITVGNLPFFVADAAIIDALSRYGRITSIAPKLLKAGEFTYTDGRREAFILLHDGITIDKLPTRFEIRIKARKHRAPYLHVRTTAHKTKSEGFFLHRIVTGDEKWIHYDNPKHRKSWVKPGHASTSTAKPNIHGKKLMLCIWWDQLGVIYYELLQPNETITGERYQQQLMRLSRALKIKRPLYAKRHDKVIYQHDNARPHVAKVVKETLEALQWDVLPHPLYSPDIAPSDYHMFRSMTHGLAEQHFTSYEEAKNWVNVWIASKDEEFFRHGIRMLPERWEKVVAKDGQYFE
ncbi:hypothetical protein LAZ67_1004952 [Cordylochernes scorpioides]|uniref:Transposase n=1 Tax=Cordylochernes scorpioides TaxID=51811 RepID=A0ABY6K0R6_9ARAC|nr:hypothetical protein LAZ67_1004952 [Cordylochernes scorpioides]